MSVNRHVIRNTRIEHYKIIALKIRLGNELNYDFEPKNELWEYCFDCFIIYHIFVED